MNVKAVLFDLDDTLTKTNQHLKKHVYKALRYLANELDIDFNQLVKLQSQAVGNAYSEAKVNEKILWPIVFRELSKEYPITEKQVKYCLDEINKIYTSSPLIMPNAKKVLETLISKDIKLALVTHASKEWTDIKIDKLNIRKYFSLVESVNVNEYKSSIHWENAVKKLGEPIKHIAAVGNSIVGDIQACDEIGITKLFWLDNEASWSVYRTGELPKGTIVIKDLIEILEHI